MPVRKLFLLYYFAFVSMNYICEFDFASEDDAYGYTVPYVTVYQAFNRTYLVTTYVLNDNEAVTSVYRSDKINSEIGELNSYKAEELDVTRHLTYMKNGLLYSD